jgi:hypothetical protein
MIADVGRKTVYTRNIVAQQGPSFSQNSALSLAV